MLTMGNGGFLEVDDFRLHMLFNKLFKKKIINKRKTIVESVQLMKASESHVLVCRLQVTDQS